jgi:hypothetical protein
MSFLESIQHGLEKASQEAARITKIQHLHNVANDLTFKASQQGEQLVARAMEMYHSGLLAQGELTSICQQIATYQQQLKEVQEELQKLQKPEDETAQQAAQIPPAPAGYPAYPPAPPAQAYPSGTVPPAYPPYPAPPAGYPAYPAPAGYPPYPTQAAYPAYPAPAAQPGYPAYPTSPSGEPPTSPGAPVPASEIETQPLAVSSEPPTSPAAPAQENSAAAPAQAVAHKAPARHHTAAQEVPAASAGNQSGSVPAAGTYANGTLPPIYSPFAKPAAPETEAEQPARAHHAAKKATDEATGNDDAPAKEKKAADK